MGIRVGIDLGTTFSAVARIDTHNGRPVIIKNGFDSPITPSVLCFERDGNVLYGEDAKSMQAIGNPNTASFFKRSIGKDLVSIDILGKSYSPTDLSAIFLEKLKKEAEMQIGENIDAAVITVPAYFTHKERAATIDAGEKAGLEVIAIINEPTAAAFAYGLNDKDTEQTVMIYDLGGGTFDVTIARIDKNQIDILGSDGEHELGGKDWDDCIARFLVSEFKEKYNVDLGKDSSIVDSLLVTAESVKKQLTARDMVNVPLNYKGIKGYVEISEEIFESISQFLIGITKDVIEKLMKLLNITWQGIDGVMLVGGSTRMRMIHNYVRDMSGKPPLGGINVDEAVALGAAIRANITEKGEAVSLIEGRVSSRKNQTVIAIQGAKAVTDVTAHSLGMISISEDGDCFINSKIIMKNSKIPASETKPFKLKTRSRGSELEVYVLQGEHNRPLDNTIIDKYVITNIEKTGTSTSVINVTYSYTSNGVIQVNAVQQETEKELQVRVEPVPADMLWTDGSPKDQLEQSKMPDVEIILAVDLSGSMYGDPLKKAQEAMAGFVDQMDSEFIKIGIVAFADSTKCILSPTDDFKAVKKTIDTLNIVNVGGSNSAEPFGLSRSALKNGEVCYLVVLTDGCWSNQGAAVAEAKKCHKDGIEVIALGFGTANQKFLTEIASVEEFATLTSLTELGNSFSKIAQAIGESSGSIEIR